MARGFVYLVAIIDWFTRKVLSWRLSNTLTADFCVDALQEALARFGRPEIFNTDQGAHQRTVHRNSEGSRGAHQYGRSWPLEFLLGNLVRMHVEAHSQLRQRRL